ncbi:integrase, catalytic region, zinc finger, CCHC-type containing protein [Tanacetum coccineum]|uniref:Integrase, catalytic region, zinc finger, CCHC-type containing protein n=1 Tax=Tanacetum coccineum TaxID=301880 RepID=A0ABQ5J4D3_9ASTR
MLEKSMYDSWASRIHLFIKEKKHGRMMLDSIDNGPLVYPTVEENGQTRPKKYSKLTEVQQLQDDCDVQVTNIILYGLLPDVYALVNHQEAAKDIWDRVKMIMKGTELSYQERECRLHNLFDKFAYVQGETLYEYYWGLSQLINDIHTIRMTMQQVQVNTKFLNALPSEWSKFVTDVKLAKSLYTTNYDQLYAYLSQHERHANEVRITRKRYPDPLAFVANSPTLYNPSQSPQHSGSLMYPPPQQFTPVYEAPIHHQYYHTLVNPQQHLVSTPTFISSSVIQQSQVEFLQLDFSLAVPMFQQREDPIECINKVMTFLSAVASRFPPSNNQLRTSSNPKNQATIQDGRVTGNFAAGQPRVVKCYNCQEEGHMARQYRWFSEAPVAQQTIPQNLAFQSDDLDAYDSDCDDLSSAKAVLMANLSSCDPEVLSEVPYSDSYPNDMINQDVKKMQYSEQTHVDYFEDNEIHNESKEKESKYIDKEIVLEKQNKELENIICKMYRSTQAMHMLTKPQVFYDDTHKQALGYQNPFHLKKAQRIQPTLYDGSVIAKEHVVISVIDDEETLILEEESRSKMLDKQNDPISIEKKIKISPIDYSKLNKIKEDFGKHFVTQKELSAE